MSLAECKILFVVCYYMLITVVAMSGLTIVSWKSHAFVKALFSYFLCQRSGFNPANLCDRDGINQLHHAGLVAVSFIFIGLLPLVNFFFTANFRETAIALSKCCSRSRQEEPGQKMEPSKREQQSLITKDTTKCHNSDTECSTEHED